MEQHPQQSKVEEQDGGSANSWAVSRVTFSVGREEWRMTTRPILKVKSWGEARYRYQYFCFLMWAHIRPYIGPMRRTGLIWLGEGLDLN